MIRAVKVRREGRNDQGQAVLAARCSCGWVHMTAYRLGRRRRACDYLLTRYNAHPCEQAEPLPDEDCPCNPPAEQAEPRTCYHGHVEPHTVHNGAVAFACAGAAEQAEPKEQP